MMHTQTGGTPLLHVPKSHIHDTNEGTFIYRKFAKLRTALFPYMYTAALEAHTAGLPLMRHHLLTFPHDRRAWASPEADFQVRHPPTPHIQPPPAHTHSLPGLLLLCRCSSCSARPSWRRRSCTRA